MGEITIENIIDLYPVYHPINDVVNITVNFNGNKVLIPLVFIILNEDKAEDFEINTENAISQKLSIYAQIDMQLNALENKAKNLRERDYSLAYSKAANIVRLLSDLNHDYLKKKLNLKTFVSDYPQSERQVVVKERSRQLR